MNTSLKVLLIPLVLFLGSCIRPQNYHPGEKSVQHLTYPSTDYFCAATFDEAYIEFDAQGRWFEPAQLNRAVRRIGELNKKPMFLMVFVHGWKNNASEDSGNVWAFRRMLDHQTWMIHQKHPDMPVMGVYLGWPGAAADFGKFFTFWNREGIAYTVGAGDIEKTLKGLMQAAKGADYQGKSNVVLIGHSFGGLVLERAMIGILNEVLDGIAAGQTVLPPADLTLILNEAAPASQAKPFLERLKTEGITYATEDKTPYPLLASMTSDGDIATKLGLPGGEFISPNRPTTVQFPVPDTFGQTSSLPYDLQSAANFDALRSHTVAELGEGSCRSGILIPGVHQKDYCIATIAPAPRNDTPYWIMALPQIFVPDHSQIFRNEVIAMTSAFLAHRGLMNPGTTTARGCGPTPLRQSALAAPAAVPAAALAAAHPAPAPSLRPALRKKEK